MRVDPATGQTTHFPMPASLPTAAGYGAAFTYGNGDIGLGYNGGELFRISIADPAATVPAFSVVAQQASAPSSNNDGTSCISAPTDLSITKSAPATVAPSATVTWHLTVAPPA